MAWSHAMFKKLAKIDTSWSLWDHVKSVWQPVSTILATGGGTALLAKFGGIIQFLGWPLTLWLSGIVGICVALLFLIYRQGNSSKIYNDSWTLLEEFTVWQAACLWAGAEPKLPIVHTTPQYPLFNLLVNAVESNELAAPPPPANHDVTWCKIKRSDLSAFVRKKHAVSKFPF